jgi:hypothetical protein
MRIENPTKSYDLSIKLNPAQGEAIIPLFCNDPTQIKTDYGASPNSWVNGFLEEFFVKSSIRSLEEVPFPAYAVGDSETARLVKNSDVEWKSPRAHLCLWKHTKRTGTPTPSEWVYMSKISLLNSYGYPDRRHNLLTEFTDNISRKLGEYTWIGASFQWVDRIFQLPVNTVEYVLQPDGLTKSTFTQPVGTGAFRLEGLRTVNGDPLPVEPVSRFVSGNLVLEFINEARVMPQTMKALISEVGNRQMLGAADSVTLDIGWSQELVAIEPDFQPSPVIVQGSVNRVDRFITSVQQNATTTRSVIFNDRLNRVSGRVTNRGANQLVYLKLGTDVTTTPFLPAGTVGATGGYHAAIGINGGVYDLPAGYQGSVSVVTATGQSGITIEETYNASSL